jgi:hypothetical protein
MFSLKSMVPTSGLQDLEFMSADRPALKKRPGLLFREFDGGLTSVIRRQRLAPRGTDLRIFLFRLVSGKPN